MLEYLQSIFGAKIKTAAWELPSSAPFYIRDGYSFQLLKWDEQACLLAKPHDTSIRLPTLKKQYFTIASMCSYSCALELQDMTSQQRQNLLENHIPFIYIPYQVYLPFWGCLFSEKYKKTIAPEGFMTPTTQMVFLYLFYTLNHGRTTATRISEKLGLAKVTVARAVEDLVSSGIFTLSVEGRRKWIFSEMDNDQLLNKAMMRMKSPVEKYAYLSELPSDIQYMEGGIRALSRLSMVSSSDLDGSAVFYKKDFSEIGNDLFIDEKVFNDFGGYAVEAWSYNPKLLSAHGIVDDISLLLSLSKNNDERVQMGLDEIRMKYGIPIDAAD